MPGSYTTPTTKARIVQLKEAGSSTKELAEEFVRHPKTIQQIVKLYSRGKSFYETGEKPARPRKLDDESYRKFIEFAKKEPWHDAPQFRQQLNLPVTDHTIQ